ncbi:acetylglutamate kinase [Anaerosporomusa subterranea]|uniref:Acetylglutamate kinase n=1 Tax=Anaerosporomusa subterranea TaxID=1794912 RepID=A0A154BV57_ANASB|nr:acetylglutamate kinase [Anaerosporomusa subterranea]KYZ77745.1 acetylglutamate kinase [Anaerosporomusa subterranea]
MSISNMEKVAVLTEALPYMQEFFGKTIVIKYGGNAMINAELKQKVVQDIIFMKYAGMKPVVVHGGGPEITAALKQMGKQSSFVGGLRVTDAETMEVAEMVLAGKINTEIVNLLNRSGVKAVGLNGKDANLTLAKKHLAQVVENSQLKEVDIGFVGDVERINPEIINMLLDNDYIPVIAPTGVDAVGNSYNINADYVAGEIAAALGAEKLLLLTDVEGLYRDFKNRAGFVSTLTFAEATTMIAKGLLDGGMIPKIESCVRALAGGAAKAHIIDGRLPHSLLLEVFTTEGIGTEVVKKGSETL